MQNCFQFFYPACWAAKPSPELYVSTKHTKSQTKFFFVADSYNSKFTYIIIQGWVFITAVYSGLDVGGAVTFGLDYNAIKVRDVE